MQLQLQHNLKFNITLYLRSSETEKLLISALCVLLTSLQTTLTGLNIITEQKSGLCDQSKHVRIGPSVTRDE